MPDPSSYPLVNIQKFFESNYQKWVRRQLGSDFVGVELTDEQIEDALREAVTLYTSAKSRIERESWTAPIGFSGHTFETKGVRGLFGPPVFEGDTRWKINSDNILSTLMSGSGVFYGLYPPYLDVRYYEYARQWVDIVRRNLSMEPDFILSPDRQSMVVYTPNREVRVSVQLTLDHVDASTIPPWGQKWIRDYTLAWCKVLVSRPRSRFGSSFKGADDTIQLDGREMLQEGREDLDRLMEDLKSQSRGHLVPIMA